MWHLRVAQQKPLWHIYVFTIRASNCLKQLKHAWGTPYDIYILKQLLLCLTVKKLEEPKLSTLIKIVRFLSIVSSTCVCLTPIIQWQILTISAKNIQWQMFPFCYGYLLNVEDNFILNYNSRPNLNLINQNIVAIYFVQKCVYSWYGLTEQD